MKSRDELNRASEHLDEAKRHSGEAAQHGKEAARHAGDALEAGASGTLERARESTEDVRRKAADASHRVADGAREAGKKAAHVADHVRHAEPDRDLEARADRATDGAMNRLGEAVKDSAPAVRKGVEATAGAAGAAMHLIARPLGAIVGKIAGRVGGWWNSAQRAVENLPDVEEERFRAQYEAYENRPADLTYETALTAYALGYVAAENPDYHGRPFDEIEPDVRHAYADEDESRHSALRDFTRSGYEHVMTIRPSQDDRASTR